MAVARPRRGRDDDVSPEATLARRLTGIIGADADVVVTHAERAPAGFDARFSAIWRRYEYRVADASATRDPLERRRTLVVPRALDVEAMDAAAASLVGLHDFAAFCRPREGATTIRTLQSYRWARADDGVLVASLQADAFCHSMVRALVGACVAVGEGRLDAADPAALLRAARAHERLQGDAGEGPRAHRGRLPRRPRARGAGGADPRTSRIARRGHRRLSFPFGAAACAGTRR